MNSEIENENIEIRLLLEAIYQKYGYDFRNYSRNHIKRRINNRKTLSGFETVLQMIHRVLYDRSFFEVLLHDFSINVTEMFRDPSFFKAIRENVIPVLKTYPSIKIWHAGCSTGEEVYSMAILLKEEGLYEKALIYATDFNNTVLEKAKEGIYSIDNLNNYILNYSKTGGRRDFSDYYSVKHDSIILDPSLKEKIIFADHNLVTDGVFGEMNMIICRNVLIYFDKELQKHVYRLFYNSLCNGGFLGLGSKESVKFTEFHHKFQPYELEERIFRKSFG
ncbi:CheR family methyltransferase [Paramaledivibacter caminithermalis]|uniref:Chemotaxis protein methyltransferase CheR n=1 Tax=Paramaledivibacter caminithermalis (strain DSM 15212 / CIP 107654 / DViRD3) TaxID=1121301 RepID=A0A1M6NPN6_PARC5|nr:protein-glutamate O-methyltransferase CheR [Paramaledivibacter caminithermalis]SHJ97634.1 chemotaxis protein methyltransferase CheR [Paramaledivibacter caminithermalis DSM 15212]